MNSKNVFYICHGERVLASIPRGRDFFLFYLIKMKPKTRLYICVAFLLLSVFCMGGSAVICLLEGGSRNYAALAVLFCCAVIFFHLVRQMVHINE